MMKEKHATITASVHKQNWKLGDIKINIASLIPLQMTKFQKFWVPEYFLYQCTLLIKIIFHFKVFFHSLTTLDDLRLAINSERNVSFHIFVACFFVVKTIIINIYNLQ